MSLVGAMLGLSGCRRSTPDAQWTVAVGDDNGFPMIVRTRAFTPASIVTIEYSHLMAIIWKYTPETNGMPSKADNQRMEELENLMEGGIEKPKETIMTTVVTCNGTREWQLYTKDEAQFMEVLNKTLVGRPVFPIEIVHQIDPDWTAWRKFTHVMKK